MQNLDLSSTRQSVVRSGVPPPSLSWLDLGLLTAGAALLVVLHLRSMGSDGVDIAHVYALTFRLSENWQLLPNDQTLGEMNDYPRLSHLLAVFLGYPFHSPFLGIQMASLLALALLWGSVIYLMHLQAAEVASISSGVLALFTLLNWLLFYFDIHGSEIVKNFFYSQLIAQAICLGGLAWAAGLESRGFKQAAYGVLAATAAISVNAHLLPALEILAVLAGAAVLNICWQITTNTNQPTASASSNAALVRDLAVPTLCVVTGTASVFLNPSFQSMRAIAQHDGGFASTLHYPLGMATACVLCLFTAACLIWRSFEIEGRAENSFQKYWGLYSAAVAVLFGLQSVAAVLGVGSAYAAKKYIFGMTTFLIVSWANFLGGYLQQRYGNREALAWQRSDVKSSCVLAAAFIVCCCLSSAGRQRLNVFEVVSLEQKLLKLRDHGLPKTDSGAINVIVNLPNMPASINYMFSLAISKTSRSLAISDVLQANVITDYSRYTSVVSGRKMGNACLTMAEGLFVYDSACVIAPPNQDTLRR